MYKRSLSHRRDNRTIEEFETQITHFEKNEIAAFDIFVNDVSSHCKKTIVDYGQWGNQSGGIVEEYKGDKISDFYITYDDETHTKVEVKVHSEKWNVFTIKAKPLDGYIKEKAIVVVIQESGYVILKNQLLVDMQNGVFGSPQIYYGFSPNDKSYRLQKDVWGEYKNGNMPSNYGKKYYWNEHSLKKVRNSISFTS